MPQNATPLRLSSKAEILLSNFAFITPVANVLQFAGNSKQTKDQQ